jgi:putative ABC transport system permease protein
MIRLAIAELRTDIRLWGGPFLVALTAAAFVHIAAVYWWTLGTPAGAALIESFGSTVDEARAGSYLVYVTTAIPAIAVLGSTSAATIHALSTRIARWRLSGALPAQVKRSVIIQVLVVNVAGAVVGVLVATPFLQPAIDLLVQMVTRTPQSIPVDNSPTAALLTIIASSLVCYFAALRPAGRASRVPAVHAIRLTETPGRSMSVSRWILGGILACLTLLQLAITGLLAATSTGDIGMAAENLTLTLYLGVLLLATIAAFAPALVPALITAWTAIIPADASTPWFLSRHSAATHPAQTSAAVLPITVGLGLYGILFGVIATWQNALIAQGSTVQLNSLDTYVMLTPAAVITLVGTIASVIMTTRKRVRDYALLRTAGANPGTLLAASLAHAIIYTLTAFALALTITAITVSAAALALTPSGAPFAPSIDIRQIGGLALVGFIGLLCAVGAPALTAIRSNPRNSITAP